MPYNAILFRKSTLNIWRISPVCLRRLRPMPCSLALWCALGQVTGRISASSLFLSLQSSEWSLQCTKVAHRFNGYLGCTKMHRFNAPCEKNESLSSFLAVSSWTFTHTFDTPCWSFRVKVSHETPRMVLYAALFGGVEAVRSCVQIIPWRFVNLLTMLECWRHVLSHCLKSELRSRWCEFQVEMPWDAPGYQELSGGLSQLSGGFRRYPLVN